MVDSALFRGGDGGLASHVSRGASGSASIEGRTVKDWSSWVFGCSVSE
jgi:hypothetical protein